MLHVEQNLRTYCPLLTRTPLTLMVWAGSLLTLWRKQTGPIKNRSIYHYICHHPVIITC